MRDFFLPLSVNRAQKVYTTEVFNQFSFSIFFNTLLGVIVDIQGVVMSSAFFLLHFVLLHGAHLYKGAI